MSKRAAILALFEQRAFAARIITTATNPPADDDYQRRLRHWAADCAQRSIHLLHDTPIAYQCALNALQAARDLAASPLTLNISPDLAALYDAAKRTAFSPYSEARLAAALAAHQNVFVGALGASTHSRRAIQNANPRYQPQPDVLELDWQAHRLKQWLQDDEPAPLDVAANRV